MSTRQLALVKLTFCGPSDVAKEIGLAQSVVAEWNQLHSEARGLCVKHHHWSTDVFPDLAERGQQVINRQLIDKSKILVAIFWSRFGTPTGTAASGTEEEILRASAQGRKVFVYFSDLEPKPASADSQQLEMLWNFRQKLRQRGICWSFTSRDQFKKLFTNHLTLALNAFEPQNQSPKPLRRPRTRGKQNAKGDNIVQVAGNGNTTAGRDVNVYYGEGKAPRGRAKPPDDVVTEEQAVKLQQLMIEVIELDSGSPQGKKLTPGQLHRKWWGALSRVVPKTTYTNYSQAKYKRAMTWLRQQRARLIFGAAEKQPELARSAMIRAIHAYLSRSGLNQFSCYDGWSQRLGISPAFRSTKDLSDHDLKRVYNAMRSDT